MNGQLIEAVHFEWEKLPPYSYVRNIKALQSVQEIDFSNAVTFFVGENGSGKSTLLEAMAVAHGFNPEGGTMNYRFSTHDSHSELCDAIRLVHGHFEKNGATFCAQKASIQLPPKKSYTPNPDRAPNPNTTIDNLAAKAF